MSGDCLVKINPTVSSPSFARRSCQRADANRLHEQSLTGSTAWRSSLRAADFWIWKKAPTVFQKFDPPCGNTLRLDNTFVCTGSRLSLLA